MTNNPPTYVSTTNACKLCTPLGACLAFKGIEDTVPYLHGSQGCATYMRRYIISHFNEPIDIASSSLSEKHAVYGGAPNLKLGLVNVSRKYRPRLIGIATTCLTETIGDDVPMFLREFEAETRGKRPLLVHASTPSYSGTHMDGFHGAIAAIIDQLVEQENTEPGKGINLLPGFISPADTRYLREIIDDFGLQATILPDLSETMDGTIARTYQKIQPGGTPLAAIHNMGRARATIELGRTLAQPSPGMRLEQKCGVKRYTLGMPVGIEETDRFFAVLGELADRPVPARYMSERGRLVDSYVDCHKYVFGKRAIIYGEEDLVVGMSALLAEIGIRPVLCASGGKSGRLATAVQEVTGSMLTRQPQVHEGMDFFDIAELAGELKPDLLVGNSKGYPLARKLDIPLIRVGFPIHDRMGGQRILHLGYQGAQTLFDRIVNALLARKQDTSPVGYSYM